jgi:hypothetical protein
MTRAPCGERFLRSSPSFCHWTDAPASAQTGTTDRRSQKEGKLVIYASATAPQLQMYFTAFNKRYPFIKTEFFRTGKQKLVSKILFEEKPNNISRT